MSKINFFDLRLGRVSGYLPFFMLYFEGSYHRSRLNLPLNFTKILSVFEKLS